MPQQPKQLHRESNDGVVLNLNTDLKALKIDPIRLGGSGAILRKLLGKPTESHTRVSLNKTTLATIAVKSDCVEIAPSLSHTGYVDGLRIEYSCYLFALLLLKFLMSVASGIHGTTIIIKPSEEYGSFWIELNRLCHVAGSKTGEWSLEKLFECKRLIEVYAAEEIRNLKSYDLIEI